MSLSGFNKVWASPKTELGRISDEFSVVWVAVSLDVPQLTITSAQVQGVAGLVKGKSSYGMRVQKSSFAQAWKQLKPQEPMPSQIETSLIYKLEPLPFRCNPKALADWSDHVGWPFKAIRAVGPRCWIVGTNKQPPVKPLVFNGQMVLPVLLPPKQSAFKSPIVAGPRARPEDMVDPWMTSPDPWGSQAPVAPVAARAVTGPTEQKFQQQEAKLQTLEQQLTQLSARQDEHSMQMTQMRSDLSKTEDKLAANITQAMQEVKNELSSSFSQSMKQQAQQFDSNFRQLRELLKPAKRKTAAAGDDEEMSG